MGRIIQKSQDTGGTDEYTLELLRAWGKKYKIDPQEIKGYESFVFGLHPERRAVAVPKGEELLQFKHIDPLNHTQYSSSFIKIIDTRGHLIALIHNPPQLNLLAMRAKQLAEMGIVRILILKARREGISTEIESILVHSSVMIPFCKCGIIAHDDETTTYLFNMAKAMYNYIPPELQPALQKSNRKELLFAKRYANPELESDASDLGLQSDIWVQTAGAKGLGRAKTFHKLHFSEVAWYDKPEENIYGIMQALSDERGTEAYMETTANGRNYFYDMWQAACAGETDWWPLFCSWLDMPTYRRPLQPGFSEKFNEEEVRMMEQGADPEQINWHRWMLKNKLDRDYNRWHQEYPTVPEDAFIATGHLVFHVDGLNRVKESIKEPRYGELLVIEEQKYYRFNPNDLGHLEIWEEPQDGFCYAGGVDFATKTEIRQGELDETVISIFRRGIPDEILVCNHMTAPPTNLIGSARKPVKVAQWRGNPYLDDAATLAANLGWWYNYAWLNPEATGVGEGPVDMLIKIYGRLLPRYTFAKRRQSIIKGAYGFKTARGDDGARSVLVREWNKALRDDLVDVLSRDSAKQYDTFVYHKNKPQAEPGKKDDIVFADMLSWFGHLHAPMSLPPKYKKAMSRKRTQYTPMLEGTGY